MTFPVYPLQAEEVLLCKIGNEELKYHFTGTIALFPAANALAIQTHITHVRARPVGFCDQMLKTATFY